VHTDISSVRKLGFAGAPMTDGLLKKLDQTFKPDLFVNHYGSSEIYTFTIEPNPVAKPGSAGRAGINQHVKSSNSKLGQRRTRPSPTRKAKSSRCLQATNRLRAIGGVPMRTPNRCERAGISPAIPVLRIGMAICSSPVASTT